MTKVCLACKQELPTDLFSVVRVKGVQKHQQATCKPCMAAYRKAYYEANKERCKEQVREWNKRNPDYHTIWRKENPDKVKQSRAAGASKRREHAKIKISAAERDILMMRWSKMRRCCALEMQVQ